MLGAEYWNLLQESLHHQPPLGQISFQFKIQQRSLDAPHENNQQPEENKKNISHSFKKKRGKEVGDEKKKKRRKINNKTSQHA